MKRIILMCLCAVGAAPGRRVEIRQASACSIRCGARRIGRMLENDSICI